MEIFTLLLIALGLSMDAFAVTVSNGIYYKDFGKKEAVISSLTFGLFQAVMPMLGNLAGRTFSYAFMSADHWVALILLGFIGGKMILGAIKEMRGNKSVEKDKQYTLKILIIQGVATSIDAFAVGISFAFINADIYLASAFIGVITFLCCIFGAFIGNKIGEMLKEKAEITGGLILVGIGIKIFLEHMLAA